MSFLTYTSHPVLFATSVGGVTLGVTLLLLPSKIISFGNFSFQSSPESQLQLTNGEGNCKVVNDFQEIMEHMSLSSSHVAIFCKNRGIEEDEDSVFLKNWKALFPRDFFARREILTKDYKLNINTNTNTQEWGAEAYQTLFKSDIFSSISHIIGGWSHEDPIIIKDSFLYPVRLVFPKNLEKTAKIYIVYNYGDR